MTRRQNLFVSTAVGVAFAAAALMSPASAGEARIATAGGFYNIHLRSLQERKFESVVKQEYDFSCGSAALATLLTYHYKRPITEAQVFDTMWAVGDKNAIRVKGFSLLDMKLYLESIGLRADGFRVPLDKLRQVAVPTIALINRNGYAHFVVLRGISADYVVLGDPARGSVTERRDVFEKQWNGIAFAIHNDTPVARAHFNLVRDLPLERRAYLGLAMNRTDLSSITVMLPRGPNDF